MFNSMFDCLCVCLLVCPVYRHAIQAIDLRFLQNSNCGQFSKVFRPKPPSFSRLGKPEAPGVNVQIFHTPLNN